MSYLTNFAICEQLAENLQAEQGLNALAQKYYQKDFTVQVGFDENKQDWEKVSPFIIILPGTEKADDKGISEYGIDILLGIFDNKVNNEIIDYLQGFKFVSDDVLPLLLSSADKTASKLSTWLDSYDLYFNQENFPLIYADISLTFLKQLAIGERRF